LQARFNPVTVRGELTGYSRAASGHCYFSLKDASGQLRCAMFKRAAGGLDFAPRDGELVEVQGRLGVYEPRGDLQLIVEGMRRAGQGSLFEEFLKLKARLDAQGLFDADRKRALPVMPRAIGLVTSLGAAALHDLVTALQRRVPHIPVVLAPASVQGANAPAELTAALSALYQLKTVPIDVILLVRGGGALEDLWAFNDEALARLMVQSPVPIICGVGHETDFTIADFVADLRAPTPTAAAELVAQPREAWLGALDQAQRRLSDAVLRTLDRQGQRLDRAVARLGRPSERLASQHLRLAASAHGLHSAVRHFVQQKEQHQQRLTAQMPTALQRAWQQQAQRLERASLRLNLLDPHLVLARGYAMLSDAQGNTVASCRQTAPGQALTATLVDGTVDLRVV
jgi:exodeoxyribonuclease VII large subunit